MASDFAAYIADAFAMMAALGLWGIALLLVGATYQASKYFGLWAAASIGDSNSWRFSKAKLENISGFVTGCVIFSVLVIGITMEQQAIKRSEPSQIHEATKP